MKNIYSIKALRMRLKITQTKAAAALGISFDMYRAHEANPSLMSFGEIEKLAVLFSISFNEMMELVPLQMEGFAKGVKK